jgi:serine/threonine-protein kinase HipA
MRLAARAGIDVAVARIVDIERVPIAIIERFDRVPGGWRIPYLSAASMLQASREEDRSYTEIADAIRAHGDEPTRDLQQLWRRMLFNLLVTNVDDHLQNLGFLHVAHGHWRLAPAFDINPFPDKERESKTWLSETHGPITDVAALLAHAMVFALTPRDAMRCLEEVYTAVRGWRRVATSAEVGLKPRELADFAPAFEHEEMDAARAALRKAGA